MAKRIMIRKGDVFLNSIISLINQRELHNFIAFRLFFHEILLSLLLELVAERNKHNFRDR